MPARRHRLPPVSLRLPPDLIGAAPSVRRAVEGTRRAAASSDPVLISAEPGFSGERVARAIHDAGSRSGLLFVRVDCTEGPTAVTRALFGPGALPRSGWETASSGSALSKVSAGTLFLAAVEELPASAQVRLSRLLRDGELRVARAIEPVRFRIIASTTPDLECDVQARRFRPELYRRLQRIRIDVPPLRTRRADLPAIIDAVLTELDDRSPVPWKVDPAAAAALAALQWVGNLDEMRAALSRLAERSGNGLIRQEDVLADLQASGSRGRRNGTVSLRDARITFERDYIETVLEESGWRMTHAARVLGIERANLYRKTRQLGITRLKPLTTR